MELLKKFLPIYKKQGEDIIENKFYIYQNPNKNYVLQIFKGKAFESQNNTPQNLIVSTSKDFCFREAERVYQLKQTIEHYKTVPSMNIKIAESWKDLTKKEKLYFIEQAL